MTRQKPAAKPSGPLEANPPARRQGGGSRELIESIVVAFVLAFLFRTFEAEAFVIPTGSMAPTLLGLHKDVVCPECGTHYAVGVRDDESEDRDAREEVVETICPNCRFVCRLSGAMARSYAGDRILVEKYPYEVPGPAGQPRRWDVFVFRYPIKAQTNYIKRLIGLPNERLKVSYGDILVQKRRGGPFQIARKPLDKQRVLEMLVFDNDRLPRTLAGRPSGWKADWVRWRPDADRGWTVRNAGRSFDFQAPVGDDRAWHAIAYHHIVPTPADWEGLVNNRQPRLYDEPPMVQYKFNQWDRNHDGVITADEFPGPLEDFRRADRNGDGSLDFDEMAEYLHRPRPQLITDFYPYDTKFVRPVQEYGGERSDRFDGLPANWVGDLTLHCTAQVETARGGLRLELNEGVDRFACEFNLATGACTLWRGPTRLGPPRPSPVAGPGVYRIAFANVDQRLTVWVNDRTIFGDGVEYDPPKQRGPTRGDLRPATIAFRGTSGRLSGLVLNRDIYYTLARPGEPDFAWSSERLGDQGWPDFLSDPTRWESLRRIEARVWPEDTPDGRPVWLGPDQFMAMGDNSPMSKDSRMWTKYETYDVPPRNFGPPSPQVDRRLLVGRAWFLYFPQSWFPFVPQWSRMKFIK